MTHHITSTTTHTRHSTGNTRDRNSLRLQDRANIKFSNWTKFLNWNRTGTGVKTTRVAVDQTTRPQVLTKHLCPVPTPTIQPCHVLPASNVMVLLGVRLAFWKTTGSTNHRNTSHHKVTSLTWTINRKAKHNLHTLHTYTQTHKLYVQGKYVSA